MNYLRRFNESKEVNLNLTEKEVKLLIMMLKDLEDIRGDMSCNDPYPKEEKIFTREERKDINRFLGSTDHMTMRDARDLEDFMYNSTYPSYIWRKLKSQLSN